MHHRAYNIYTSVWMKRFVYTYRVLPYPVLLYQRLLQLLRTYSGVVLPSSNVTLGFCPNIPLSSDGVLLIFENPCLLTIVSHQAYIQRHLRVKLSKNVSVNLMWDGLKRIISEHQN